MSGARWRPRLSTRITFAVVAVAVSVAAVATGTLLWNARVIILESRQAAIYELFTASARTALATLPDSPRADDLAAAAELFSQPTVLIDLATAESAGTLPLGEVPEYLVYALAAGELTAYERSTRRGMLLFTVGLSMPAGAFREGNDLAVFSIYPMQEQQEQIDTLVGLGAAVGAVFVAGSALAGVLVGRRLGRPLERLVEVAGGLGRRRRPPDEDTGYPDVDAILEAMRGSADELDSTIRRLEHSEATARRLVADVAHELRTPLASIVAVSDILADTEAATADERREAGEIAARGGLHLTALTNDILEMSRFDAGRSVVTPETFDVDALWQELTTLRQWDGVELRRTGDAAVHTDARRVALILSNLVTNALRHGERPVEVRIAAGPAELTITVRDAGPGIPDTHAAHVFERFYKASAARASSESSGLGLAIVRENARILGGDAWLDQEDGTVFTVRIPLGGRSPESQPAGR